MPPVTGSTLWVKSDTGTYQDVAGTTAASSDGDVVGLWQDQSGNGNDFTAVTDGSHRPTLQLNEINSLPVIRADGVDDYLRTAGNVTLTDFTVHCVVVPREFGTGNRLLYQYDGADGWFLWNSDRDTVRHLNTNATLPGALTLNAPHIVTIQRGNGAITLRINGVEVATAAITVPTTIDEIYMFVDVSLANDAEADMAEVLVYDSELSSADVDTNESYLATRYDMDLETAGTKILWLKADTEIYQDVAATTAASTDGDAVGLWQDQSGKGNHFTAVSDSTNRPTLKTNIFNSLPVVRADGVDDYLRSISNIWLEEFTLIAAMAPRERGTATRLLYQYDGADGWWLIADDNNAFHHATPDADADGCYSLGAVNIISVTRSSSAISFRRNGEEIASTSLASAPTTIDEIYAFVDNALGNDTGADLAELIIQRGVDTTSRDADESYLATRFGVSLVSPTWTQLASAPAGREQHGFEEAGGLLYAVAGYNAATQDDIWTYNPATDTWDNTLTVLPSNRQSGVLRAVNGKLYYIGGLTGTTIGTVTGAVHEYDPATDTWTAKTSKPTPVEDFGSAVYDGKIYCFGGLRDVGGTPTPVATLEVYDPDTDTWDTTKADMPAAKWSGDFGAAYDGKIYAIGSAESYAGYPSMTPVATMYVYDVAGDSWSTGTPMPEGQAYKEVAIINDDLYVVSGTVTPNATTYTHSVWRYDITGDAWHYVGAAPNAVRGSALAVYDGEIYMVGGYDGSVTAELWKLTPASGGGNGVIGAKLLNHPALFGGVTML